MQKGTTTPPLLPKTGPFRSDNIISCELASRSYLIVRGNALTEPAKKDRLENTVKLLGSMVKAAYLT